MIVKCACILYICELNKNVNQQLTVLASWGEIFETRFHILEKEPTLIAQVAANMKNKYGNNFARVYSNPIIEYIQHQPYNQGTKVVKRNLTAAQEGFCQYVLCFGRQYTNQPRNDYTYSITHQGNLHLNPLILDEGY